MSDPVNFAIVTGGFTGQYRVRVVPEKGDEYRAKLISVGIGTILESAGRSPGEAVRNLVDDLEHGDAYDKRIGVEIRKYAQWAFRK